jgi:hypothetical protein
VLFLLPTLATEPPTVFEFVEGGSDGFFGTRFRSLLIPKNPWLGSARMRFGDEILTAPTECAGGIGSELVSINGGWN